MPAPDSDATVTGMVARIDLAIGGVVAGRFRIDELLGIGGMGVVYRAWDVQLDIPVAIKLLRPEFARRPDAFARFREEVLLSRQVSSPHVVRIHDLVADGERWLLGMDWIDGGSLEALLDREGRLPVEQVVAIARQVALGLGAAHARGVIHRDLKPANVLLDRAGNAYVSDFGVARAAGSTGLTGTGVIVGTPDYLSPEQARGQGLDGRSDLYALGLIMFEMLCGRLPFEPGTGAETAVRRLVQPAPSVARFRTETPAWLVRLVARLLATRPQHRLADADAVVRAIDARRVSRGPITWRRHGTAAAATALVSAIAALTWNFDTWVAPRLEQWGVRRAALEWTVLPLAAAADDAAIARAIDELVARQLIDAGVATAESSRVHRILRLLALDADSATGEIGRLADTLPSHGWIAGRFNTDAGRHRIELQRIDADPDTRDPQATRGGLTADAIAPALGALLAEFEVRTGPSTDWPVAATTLADFGVALSASPPAAIAALERCIAAEPRFATAWTERLRRSVSPAAADDAADIAARARAALAGGAGPAVERALAWSAWAAGDLDDARIRFERINAANPADLDSRIAHASVLAETGEHLLASAAFDAVLARDPHDVAVLVAAGRLALDAGDPQRAIDRYFGRALQVATRLDDRAREGDALNGLGVAYERLGQAAPAIDHYTRAAALREAIGDARGAAMSLRNLAHNHAIAGQFDAAQAQLARARELLEPVADAAALAALATDEGILAEERGDYAAASRAYLAALSARRGTDDPAGIAEAQLHLGFVHGQTGEYASARVNLAAAADTYAQLQDPVGVLHAQQALALLDLADADLDAARTRIEASARSAQTLQLAEERAVSAVLAAELALLDGRRADADAALVDAERSFAARDDRRGLDEVALLRIRVLQLHDAPAAATALRALADAPPARSEQRITLTLLAARQSLLEGRADEAAAAAAGAAAAALAAGLRPLAVQGSLLTAEAHSAAARSADAARSLADALALIGDDPPRRLALERDAVALALQLPTALKATYAGWLEAAGPLAAGTLGATAHRIVARRADADADTRARAEQALRAASMPPPGGTPAATDAPATRS